MEEILDDQFLEEKLKRQQKSKWFYFLLSLLSVGSIISTFIAWYDVESIVGSGPLMSFIGLVFFFYLLKTNPKPMILIGLIPLAFSIFWIIMINAFSLSPNDCKTIVPLSLIFGSALILFIGILAFLTHRD